MFKKAMELDNKSALRQSSLQKGDLYHEARILGARRSTGQHVGSARSTD
jgi:hypothetical protein